AEEYERSAVEQAKQKAEKLLSDARAEMQERERRITAVAEIEIKKQELAAKRIVLDEAYEAALVKLASLDTDSYRELYIKTVLPAITKGTETIAPSRRDKDRLGQAFLDMLNKRLEAKGIKAELKPAPPRDDADFGLWVIDGSCEIDFTNKAVIRAVREKTEGETAKLLFAGGK
ncbi:MAG: hypothetical protein GX860_10455, partial [Alcaligenaceae bacterium]|nr:hypothetical protein [Alcaligenaceae bacterium]